jgi:hypothetical protein
MMGLKSELNSDNKDKMNSGRVTATVEATAEAGFRPPNSHRQ